MPYTKAFRQHMEKPINSTNIRFTFFVVLKKFCIVGLVFMNLLQSTLSSFSSLLINFV